MAPVSGEPPDRMFWVARDDEVKSARTTDVYLRYGSTVLEKSGVDPEVTMEVYARAVPYPENWGVVLGIYEVAKLLEGLDLDVDAMEAGGLFLTRPDSP